MKITLTYGECNTVVSALSVLIDSDKSYTSDTSFAFAYTLQALQEAAGEFETKKQNIINKYAALDKDGNFKKDESNQIIWDKEDGEDKAEKDLTALVKKEVTITLDEDELLTSAKLKKEDTPIPTIRVLQLKPILDAIKKATVEEKE